MGARGRKSTAELAVIGSSGVVSVHRPQPPEELTEEQAAEWRAIVNAHAADRFTREQYTMLLQHCRHTVAARRVGQLVAQAEAAEPFDVEEYDRALRMQDRESGRLASLAVRLGFAYSTAYEKRPAKGKKAGPKPWEFEGRAEHPVD